MNRPARYSHASLAIPALCLVAMISGNATFGATFSRAVEADADEIQIEYGTPPYHIVRTGLYYIGNYDNVPFPDLYIDDTNFRLNNISIPRGSVINSATLALDIQASRAAAVPTEVSAFAGDNCAPLSESNFSGTWMANQQLTSSKVNWTIPAGTQTNTSPDLAAIVSEIVNRPGWVSGNSICIFVKYTGLGIQDPDRHHEELVFSCGFQDGVNNPCGDNTSHPAVLTIDYSLAGALPVSIDIKPGSFPNSINLGSSGVVPVAILSSPTFDATQVDPATVTLAGAAVRLMGKGTKYSCSAQDVNGDGRLDLVCHVVTAQLLIELGDTVAVLEAETFSGQSIHGEDSIRIVP